MNKQRTNDEHTADLSSLLHAKLSSNAHDLADVLRTLEMHYIRTIEARIQTHTDLIAARDKYRHPKDKELTDWDRKILLDANTESEQAAYDTALGQEKALELRISVIQTLLVQ